MLLYDNVDDLKSKLVGTIIYYKDEPVYVRDANVLEADGAGNPTNYYLKLAFIDRRNHQTVNLADPGLNYQQFKIGYCNINGIAVYWFRKAVKQYRQGLKSDQLHYSISNPRLNMGFELQFSRPVVQMLSGIYPSVDEAIEVLQGDVGVSNIAFNRHFAMSFDAVHKDYILEYKGTYVAHSPNMKNITFINNFGYVKESLMEVLGV